MQETARANWPMLHGVDSTRSAAGPTTFVDRHNPELDHKVKRACDKFSESQHIVANEPSLAFFRIQEHVRKSLPMLVEKKHDVEDLQESVKGSCFDTEYAINAVKGMERSRPHFQSIQEMMKNAMFMKQQLHYEQARSVEAEGSPARARSSSLTGRQHRLGTVFR